MTVATQGSIWRITPQVIIGLIVIAFGLTLTADNLGWVHADEVWRYWPFLLVAVGVAKVLQTGARSGQVFGVILIFIGSSVAIDEFWTVRINLFAYWPLVLVLVGLILVGRAWRGPVDPAAVVRGATTDDQTLSEFAFWSGIKRRVASPAFRGADLTAIMGGIELDLRPAGTASGEAVIDVFVLWGGIELTVPPDWDVSNRVVPIMGGAADQSAGTQDARHRLVIRGFVVMGGVDIKT